MCRTPGQDDGGQRPRGQPYGLGPLALATGAVVAALATACVWPALDSSRSAALLVVAVAVAFATTGAAIAPPQVSGGICVMLILTGVLWALSWSALWQTGPWPALSLLAGTSFWVTMVWGCLRYPTGRLDDPVDRAFLAALVFFLPVLVTVGTTVSVPADHGFHDDVWWPRLAHHELAFDVIVWVVSVGSLVLSLCFVAVVRRRLTRLAAVERRVIAPVAVAAVVAGLASGVTSLFELNPGGTDVSPVLVPAALALLGVPLAFPIAAVFRRLTSAAAADLLVRLAQPSSVEAVRQALGEALHDDTVEIVYRLPDSDDYVDGRGWLVPAPAWIPEPGRLTLPVRSADGSVVALVRADQALSRQRDLVEAAIAASGLAIENTRLHAVLRDQLTRVRASRAKVVEAGLEERRRIERDLHDGAQQHLLALAAWLGLARSQAETPSTLEAVDEARTLLQDTLRELRRLARGIHPTILGQEGLEAALDSAAQTLPMRVDVHIDVPEERLDPTAETVAYLTAWDTLTYLARSGDAGPATVRIHREHTNLWVHVGFEDLAERDHAQAVALNVIRDRLRAFDGELRLGQSADDGFDLTARIPATEPVSATSPTPGSAI